MNPPRGNLVDDLETLVEPYDGDRIKPDELSIPEFVGPYRLLRQLGKGGMGMVYLARQVEPVDRLVAIKLIATRVNDASALARFVVERQALAQMSHPAIAQVYEAGTTASGYPYLTMEFVNGQRLDRYCHARRLSVPERLDLFLAICRGVHHAHQRGVVHRDLKPANILIASVDGQPAPKIIDFGIATAAAGSGRGSTHSRDVVGTPQYMSPEQFRIDGTVIDPRCDVYSLGVILHELLVDDPPIQGALLSHRDSHSLSQVFAQFQPLPAPSSRLGSDAQNDEQIASLRRTTARRLRRQLRGDLDAVVLKALAQDCEQRYPSVAELADDIERIGNYRPVTAVPDSHGYRASRFVRRHIIALGTASAILLALLAGLGAATLGMIEARKQYRIAEQRQQQLEELSDFQQAMLAGIDPQQMGLTLIEGMRAQLGQSASETSATEPSRRLIESFNATDLARGMIEQHMLQRAGESIEREFAGRPLLQARLYQSLASVYDSLGLHEPLLDLNQRILELLENELPADHLEVLQARHRLGYAQFHANQRSAAEDTLGRLIEDLDPQRGDLLEVRIRAHLDLANALVDQAKFEPALEAARQGNRLAYAELPTDHRLRLETETNLGYVLARQGRVDEALERFQSAYQGYSDIDGEAHSRTIGAMLNVSAALGALGRYEQAADMDHKVLAALERSVGRRHIHTIRVLNNLSNNLRWLGQTEQAASHLREAIDLCRELYGPTHPVTLRARLNLGSLLTHIGQWNSGLEIIDEVIGDRTATLGPDHPDTLSAQEIRTSNLYEQARFGEALDQIQPVLDGRAVAFGAEHPLTLKARWLRAKAFESLGRIDEAIDDMRTVVELDMAAGRRARNELERVVSLYRLYLDRDRSTEAQELYNHHLEWLTSSAPDALEDDLRQLRQELLADRAAD